MSMHPRGSSIDGSLTFGNDCVCNQSSPQEEPMSATQQTPVIAPAGTWSVDASHSNVGFAVKHLGIATVRGSFEEFQGTLELGEDLSGSKASGTVVTGSITTREERRDAPLRPPALLSAGAAPPRTLLSRAVRPHGA